MPMDRHTNKCMHTILSFSFLKMHQYTLTFIRSSMLLIVEGAFECSSSFSSFSSIFYFISILNGINICFDTCLTMQIQEHVSELNWSSRWVILSILAHPAHLAPSYFSLIFSAFNTYNCSWFNLTNEKNMLWLKTKVCLQLFSSQR